MTYKTALSRFIDKIDIAENGCWNWTAALSPNGYGVLGIDGRTIKAHRFAYEYFVGQIPPELEIDHLCRNRICSNPAHLEPVTHYENLIRGNKRPSSHSNYCKHGHLYTQDNTYYHPNRVGRECVACRSEQRRKWREKNNGKS